MTTQITVTLVSDAFGYADYDVSGHPGGIRRAKVPPRLAAGDVFNVYLGESTKLGCPWLGSVKKSLTNFTVPAEDIERANQAEKDTE